MSQEKPIIVTTRRWPESVEEKLAALGELRLNEPDEPFSPDALTEALTQADVICPTVTDRLDADAFARADANGGVRTRLLANFGVGYNHIDVGAARDRGIAVTNTPGVLTDATAEIALALLMMTARRTGEGERHVRADQWAGWRPTHMLSTQVTGKTLGIVGMGRIGLAFARMVHRGLGMRILYASRNPVAESVALELAAEFVSVDELVARSDFISLHCPATPETRHLIDARRLALCQPHAHIINTARGDVIDEPALVEALKNRQIAGAGLDVYVAEPNLAPGLKDLENVVLLPHMGSGTVETREAMGMCAYDNVAAHLRGHTLPNPV